MEAKERSFIFMSNASYYDIPFFQRAYVWKEENWKELLNNFLDNSESYFLGSIILKQEHTKSGETLRFMVIDGQQRLTTLSVLLRACYDRLMENPDIYDKEVVDGFYADMHSLLFIKPSKFSSEESVKINHSKLDKTPYQNVINGNYSEYKFQDLELLAKDKSLKRIEQCYLYFRKELHECSDVDIQSIWNLLTTDSHRFLVNIDLGEDENEQKIFDTVNSFGVRLSSADTIKNALFQHYIDKLRLNGETEIDKKASDLFDMTWGKAFEADSDVQKYWETTKRYGRLTRDNAEVLLHALAVIGGFFDPSKDNFDILSQKYKSKIKNMGKTETEEFIRSIKEYADVFRNNFVSLDSDTLLSFNDYKKRLLHLCQALDVATFYPYILKLLYEDQGTASSSEPKELLLQLERYIVLNTICKGSTKNYNNECVQLVRSKKTPDELKDSNDSINRRNFNAGLKDMRSNKVPTALLFWVELYDRSEKYSDVEELRYKYTLEHIMPQKWETNWSIEILPVYNRAGSIINDEQDAKEERREAVYEIGNMTLLNSKLNTSLSNGTFKMKVKGDPKKYKHCMESLADLYLTREVIKLDSWDERSIRKRTDEIKEKIERIWSIEFPEDKQVHIDFNGMKPADKYVELFEEKSFEETYDIICRSDLSASNKKLYKELLLKSIIVEQCKGGLYWRGNWFLDKDLHELVEFLRADIDSELAAALLAIDEGDRKRSIECYVNAIDNGEIAGNGSLTEEAFVKYVLLPVSETIQGFYKEFIGALHNYKVDSVVVRLCQVLDQFYKSDEDAAVNCLMPLLNDYPNNVTINTILGYLYYELRDWENAIYCLEKCVGEDTLILLEENILDYLGNAYGKDSSKYSPKSSLEYYKKLLKVTPEANVYYRIGYNYKLLEHYEKAIDNYKKCLELEETHTGAANELVMAYIKLEKFDELEEFINSSPVKLRKYTLDRAGKALGKDR